MTMKYPRLSVRSARLVRDEIAAAIEDGEPLAIIEDKDFRNLESKHVEYWDCEQPLDANALYSFSMATKREMLDEAKVDKYKSNGTDNYAFYLEELMAARVHQAVDLLPPEALHDAGFWRYLGLFPYRWYMLQRERSMLNHDFGGSEGQREKWLLIRTFQWGRKCFDPRAGENYGRSLAVRLAKRRLGVSEGFTIDFYHSHIIRPRWADTSEVAGAFVDAATSAPEATDTGTEESKRPVAQMAKLVARLANNVCLPALSGDEVRAMFESEKLRILRVANA